LYGSLRKSFRCVKEKRCHRRTSSAVFRHESFGCVKEMGDYLNKIYLALI